MQQNQGRGARPLTDAEWDRAEELCREWQIEVTEVMLAAVPLVPQQTPGHLQMLVAFLREHFPQIVLMDVPSGYVVMRYLLERAILRMLDRLEETEGTVEDPER
jgi:hypothetical protein